MSRYTNVRELQSQFESRKMNHLLKCEYQRALILQKSKILANVRESKTMMAQQQQQKEGGGSLGMSPRAASLDFNERESEREEKELNVSWLGLSGLIFIKAEFYIIIT